MKRIPQIIVRDYLLLSFGFFVFFTLMRPFGLRNSVGDSLWMLQSLGCSVLIFLGAMMIECVVTFAFHLPCDYSCDWKYQIRRKAIFYPILIVVLSAVIGQYFTIIEHGWRKWYFFWTDSEGDFYLGWFLNNLAQDIVWCIFIALYWYYATNVRMKEHKIQELLAINENIENAARDNEEKLDAISIKGDSMDILKISPSDILYIESLANYLCICYFSEGELGQKRLRSTLKNVEEQLAEYRFLLHCHRAFVVNTRFISHVDGNASGCQLHLSGTERVIPVSKANIEALRKALS